MKKNGLAKLGFGLLFATLGLSGCGGISQSSSVKTVRLTNNPGRDRSPNWSPDGRRITFYSTRDDPDPAGCKTCNFDIYVMNADGSNVTRLTDDPAYDEDPAWSPDGTRIAFASTRNGYFSIYVMNADGSEVTPLTDSPARDVDPVWSPDGTQIVFTSTRDDPVPVGCQECNDDIYIMGADGSDVTNLTNDPDLDLFPTWSPDGTRIAFASNRDGDTDIYVMNADGSNVTCLTDNSADDWEPDWSPDGTRIAFQSNRDGAVDLYFMNVDGGNVTRLIGGALSPDWSPDGKQLAFISSRDDEKYEIYTAEM